MTPLLPMPVTAPSATSPISSMTNSDKAGDADMTTIDAKLQISVLLAMPDSNRPQWPSIQSSLMSSGDSSSQTFSDFSLKGKKKYANNDYDDDEELPEVVFGVTELPWQLTASLPPVPSTATSGP